MSIRKKLSCRSARFLAAAICLALASTSLRAQEEQQSALAAAGKASAAKQVTDKDITGAVENALLTESAIPYHLLDVNVTDGIVTLSGSVDNLLARERASVIAETIRGVRSVINKIAVKPVSRTDEQIKADVEQALAADPATDSYQITTSVENGVVTLTGIANSYGEYELSAHVAKGVKGVREVKNDITLQYKEGRADAEIAADAQRALETDAWINTARLTVAVQDGKATLMGPVRNAVAKRRATHIALGTTGVRSVDASKLEVVPWLQSGDKRKTPQAAIADGEIEKALKAALALDPRMAAFDVDAAVKSGFVTLSGMVDNLKAKRAAEQVAHSTVGVINVRNHLKVRPTEEVKHEQLLQRVRQALVRDPFVDRFEILVTVQNGTVTLAGTVDTNFEKATAEDITSRINGVVHVNNRLNVQVPTLDYFQLPHERDLSLGTFYYIEPPVPTMTDAQIAQGIKDHLRWNAFVDAEEVQVAVDGGVARLTGQVDSLREYNSATQSAFAGGAVAVRNNLKVGQ